MKKDTSTSFPFIQDIFYHIHRFTKIKYLPNFMLTSKQWRDCLLNPNYWKIRLIQDFNVTLDYLNRLEIHPEISKDLSFQKIYEKLFLLMRKQKKLTGEITFIDYLSASLSEIMQRPFFLALYLDDEDYFFQNMAGINNYQDMCLINIFSNGHKITQRLLNGHCNAITLLLAKVAIEGNNLRMLQELINTRRAQLSIGRGDLDGLFQLALRLNHFELALVLMEAFDLAYSPNKPPLASDIDFAVLLGQESILEPNKDSLDNVALLGRIDLVQLLSKEFNLKPDGFTLTQALISGNTDLVRLLFNEYGLQPNELMLYKAAIFGHLNTVRYLCKECGLAPKKIVLDLAAGSGNLKLVQWLCKEYSLEPNIDTLNSAAFKDADTVLWLCKEYVLPPNNETIENAICLGDVSLVQWLCERYSFQSNEYTLGHAARSCSVYLFQWLCKKYSLKPNIETLGRAVKFRNIGLIQLLCEEYKLKPNKDIFTKGVNSANLVLVQLLRKHIALTDINMRNEEITDQYIKNLAVFRYLLSTDFFNRYMRELTTSELQAISMIHCYSNFKRGLNAIAVNSNDFATIFTNAHNFNPEYFYHLVNMLLGFNLKKNNFKQITELLKVEVVQKTPFPQSQYILAYGILNDSSYSGDISTVDLFTAARNSFILLGNSKGVNSINQKLAKLEEEYQAKKVRIL